MTHMESALRLDAVKFVKVSRLFSLNKSPVPFTTDRHPSISELKTVEEFKNIGSAISNDGSLVKEVNAKICKACQALEIM